MTTKLALIVDDSKSARFALKRMLNELGLEVDTVQSATDALDYLEHNQPDVIFMDHMMPGMDGFEAVKRIKGNPQTVVIPIMMYTSKGGDLYLSQARALGAVGIIPKTIAPVELKESLMELGLTSDAPIKSTLVVDTAVDINLSDEEDNKENEVEAGSARHDHVLDNYLEDLRKLMDDQTIELHRSMWLGIESVSNEIFNRLNSELDNKLEKITPTETEEEPEEPVEDEKKTAWPVYMLSFLLFISVVINISLLSDIKQLENKTVVIDDEDMSVADEILDTDQSSPKDKKALLQFTKWALNRTIEYPFDELALNDNRLDNIEELVNKAVDAEYTGRIILQTHAGEFCLSSDQAGNYKLADKDLSVTSCEYIGNNIQPTDEPSSHQSLGVANYLADTALLNERGIVLEVSNVSRKSELSKYPKRDSKTIVEDWNKAAQKNNRVTVKLEPAETE